ncbi:hypothetical protein [Jannaschia ovalis]|uniref:DUF2125 domain-containing protein n=1 Tax=Jannaschia ovalis TaxID=3038773 RepID=A0ABY8L7I4_9RHOB|nr:hypothetical protein [Jannaschia sp. GRR-S6-38]WGH77336.1 hypothetical protein P8627_09760 [Jannaschia sp. GRR-S6-38]
MSKHAFAGAAALLLTTAPAAWAELSGPALWADWQDFYGRFGGALVAADERYEDGVLTLDGVRFENDIGGAATRSEGFGPIRMVEQDDGSVAIELPQSFEISTTTTVDGESITQSAQLANEGLEIVAREDGAQRVYDMAADSVSWSMADPAGDESASLGMILTGLVSTYISGGEDPNAFAQTLSADGAAVTVEATGTEAFSMAYAMEGIASDFAGVLAGAPGGDVTSLADLGLVYGGEMTHSGSTLSLDGTGDQGPFTLTGQSEAGGIEVAIDETTLSYGVRSQGGGVTVQTAAFPLPVSAAIAELTSSVTLPVGAGPEARPLGMELVLRDLVVDDSIWSLFDPTGQLPRDPATVVVDVDGSAVMTADLFGGPEAMARLQGPPGELEGVTINELVISFAGAELRGSGDLDFPTPDPTTPVGSITLALDGGFQLLDSLVALGFVPAEQAGFFKGMAGAVSRPVGDDQLESTIEFSEGGGISANGMPLR